MLLRMQYTPKRWRRSLLRPQGRTRSSFLIFFSGHRMGMRGFAGESLDPLLVVSGPLGPSLLGDGVEAMHVAEAMNDMLGASQPAGADNPG